LPKSERKKIIMGISISGNWGIDKEEERVVG
jgi:hypothetical protein